METKKESWVEMLNNCLVPNSISKKECMEIVKKAQEEEREYYFEQLGKIMDSMEKHKDCKKCYELILYDMGVRTLNNKITKEKQIDSKPWSSEEMIKLSSKLSKNVPSYDMVIPINCINMIKGLVKKEEREKIEERLENYMKGTCLKQDSIFLNLHNLVWGLKLA